MSVSLRKQIGSIMIVTGTEVGAGILALPIITARLGFITSMIVMVAAWLLMTYTALLVTDINLGMPEGTSFGKMARHILGWPGEVISWLSFLLLLYAISVAYISAASSAFEHLLPSVPQQYFAIIFVVVLGFFVLKGVAAVDVANRMLLSIKLLLFLAVSFVLLVFIDPANLLANDLNIGAFLLAVPVLITSFTSHIIIPSLRGYLESDAKAMFRVILIGSIIPLFLYVLWELSMLGVVPLHGEGSFVDNVFSQKGVSGTNIGDVLGLLNKKLNASYLMFGVNVFADISVMTSFLGVSMALYHFVQDSFGIRHIKNPVTRVGASAFATLVLPLLVVMIKPDLFVRAMGYVGVSVAVLLIILPVLMAFRLHKNNTVFHYRITSIKGLWFLAFISGLLIILAQMSG